MNRCAVCVVSCYFLFLSAAGAAHAQTPGQIPVFVNPSGALTDSTIAQDGGGNISVTSGSLTVNNTPGIGVWGESTGSTPGADGVHGVAHGPASGVAGVNDADFGVGVWGQSLGAGYGVYGVAGCCYGVYGQTTFGYAGYFEGTLGFSRLGTGGLLGPLCRDDLDQLAFCSSSLRYKTDVRPFSEGLDIVSRLRPIAFAWKQGGMQDVGLAAEDVEQVEPLLTFRNDKGEIEGVKYNQLSAVFVNAIRDQQAQIERQQKQITEQQAELAALKALVCQSHPDTDICR
jgi:hypothetical protein